MLILITKVAVVMINMITKIRITVIITEKTGTATILAKKTGVNRRESSPSAPCLAQTSQS